MEVLKSEEKETNKSLMKLVSAGIPVSKAEFKAAVNNADDIPETYFSEKSEKRNRRALMYWTQAGLICSQLNAQKEEFWFVVPTDNVKYAHFKS